MRVNLQIITGLQSHYLAPRGLLVSPAACPRPSVRPVRLVVLVDELADPRCNKRGMTPNLTESIHQMETFQYLQDELIIQRRVSFGMNLWKHKETKSETFINWGTWSLVAFLFSIRHWRI